MSVAITRSMALFWEMFHVEHFLVVVGFPWIVGVSGGSLFHVEQCFGFGDIALFEAG